MGLSKLFTNLLIFGVCLNISLYLFQSFSFNPQVQLNGVGIGDLSTWQGWFSLSAYDWLLTGGAMGVVGIASLLLKQGQYAIYAMLLAALTMVITPIKNFFLAVPNTIGLLLPPETNPLGSGTHPIVVVISLVYLFAAYWFIFGMVIGRDVS